MKHAFLTITSVLFLFVFGCATTTMTFLERDISEAENFAKKKDWEAAYKRLEDPLLSTSYKNRANEVIKLYPDIASVGIEKAIMSDLDELNKLCNEKAVKSCVGRLGILKDIGTPSSVRVSFLNKSKDTLNRCISSSPSGITLKNINEWEAKIGDSVFTQETKLVVFKRQIDEATSNPDTLDKDIEEFARKSNDAKTYFESNLPQTQWIGHSIATHTIQTLFPKYYEGVCKKNYITVNIITDPQKPLLELDLTDELNKYIMISAFQDNPNANFTVIVRELAYEEQSIPEQTIQKYVDSLNMNAFNYVLCYPKNSTAIYDVTTGGFVIRYAYRIDLLADNQKVDSITIRDSIRDSFSRASNLRYQNVFGGTGVPTCYPNADVERAFQNSSGPTSIETLRVGVFNDIFEKIKNFNSIKTAIMFGTGKKFENVQKQDNNNKTPADWTGIVIDETVHDVKVYAVAQDSPAHGKILEGDQIIEINRKSVNSITDYKSSIENMKGRTVLFLIKRNGKNYYVTVE